MNSRGSNTPPLDGHISPLIVNSLLPGDELEWDDFVHRAGSGTFFHLSGWKDVIEGAFGHKTYYLQARRAGIVAGVLPLTHIKSFLFGNSIISNSFCVYGGPLANDSETESALRREAVTLMERVGATSLEFRM